MLCIQARSLGEQNFALLLCLILQIGIQIFPIGGTATCNSRLLSDRVQVPDTAFENSSAVNAQYEASASRYDPNLEERAWCPEPVIHTEKREYMQVDLGRQSLIKIIITKGRVAQSKGRQTTPYFYIKYRRESSGPWFEYRKENGTSRLNGNSDAMTENYNSMDPPFVARFVRIYPFSFDKIQTCLKLELVGCDAKGIVEYRIPQGTLIPRDAGRASYGSNPGRHQTQLQDQSYDAENADHNAPSVGLMTSSTSPMLRGGLGKLMDNDTDWTSPFSSYKYVGWKRLLYYSRTRRDAPHSAFRRGRSWDNTHYYVQLIFRFDAVYNFTAIHLFLSNDFVHDVSIPSNISIGFTMLDPSVSQRTGTKHINVVPLVDKSNSSARWMSVDLFSTCLEHLLHREALNNTQRVLACTIANVGQYVTIDLFFNTDWIAVGEVAFENHKIDPSTVILPPPPLREVVQKLSSTAITTTTVNPLEKNAAILFESALNHGTPTTLTLSIVCGILATLICIGLLCMLYAWRRKRLRGGLRKKKVPRPENGLSNQFAKLSNLNGSNEASCPLMEQQQQLLDRQTQFQHPHNCQEKGQMTKQPNQAYLTNSRLYSTHLSPAFNMTQQPPTLFSPADPTGTLRYPNGTMLPFGAEHGGLSINSNPSDMLYFLPMSNAQNQLNHLRVSTHEPYRKTHTDNAIYTSVPGSDCDSQPYARVSNGGSGISIGHGEHTNLLPSTTYMEPHPPNLFDAPQFLQTLLPPPPSLPLPPIPKQHHSPKTDSHQHSPDEQTDSGVSVVQSHVNDASPNWSSQDQPGSTWLPPKRFRTEQLPLVNPLSAFYTMQGSDYSNMTMGSSTNGYGAYYGSPSGFPPNNPGYSVQMRR